METLKTVNWLIGIVFFVCYAYQFLYIPAVWLRRAKPHSVAKANRYAVLICARNEQAVIADLIASLHAQTYDAGLIRIFVLADNCTDDTARIARTAGATVYERFNKVQVGKGYALEALMKHIRTDFLPYLKRIVSAYIPHRVLPERESLHSTPSMISIFGTNAAQERSVPQAEHRMMLYRFPTDSAYLPAVPA